MHQFKFNIEDYHLREKRKGDNLDAHVAYFSPLVQTFLIAPTPAGKKIKLLLDIFNVDNFNMQRKKRIEGETTKSVHVCEQICSLHPSYISSHFTQD